MSEVSLQAGDDALPRVINRVLQFENGSAIGHYTLWEGGQYCAIFTRRGVVGCGAYHVPTMEHFGQAVAIARGTPQNPLVQPEDLYSAKIVEASRQAQDLGIRVGDTGREAVEKLLAAG